MTKFRFKSPKCNKKQSLWQFSLACKQAANPTQTFTDVIWIRNRLRLHPVAIKVPLDMTVLISCHFWQQFVPARGLQISIKSSNNRHFYPTKTNVRSHYRRFQTQKRNFLNQRGCARGQAGCSSHCYCFRPLPPYPIDSSSLTPTHTLDLTCVVARPTSISDPDVFVMFHRGGRHLLRTLAHSGFECLFIDGNDCESPLEQLSPPGRAPGKEKWHFYEEGSSTEEWVPMGPTRGHYYCWTPRRRRRRRHNAQRGGNLFMAAAKHYGR